MKISISSTWRRILAVGMAASCLQASGVFAQEKLPSQLSMLTGLSLAELDEADPWDVLVNLLTASHFNDDNFYAARERGRKLLEVRQYEWALKSLQHAVQMRADDAYANYLLGQNYFHLGRHADSEAPFIKSLGAPAYRQRALSYLVESLLMTDQLEKADRYARDLTKEYPQLASGWFLKGMVKWQRHDADEVRLAFQRYLQLANRSDTKEAKKMDATSQLLNSLPGQDAAAAPGAGGAPAIP